ncbi:MAG: hypothetical protein AAB116_22295, partial [Candidatus Poribacteria bacterium]
YFRQRRLPVQLQPLVKVKVFIDDLSRTLVNFAGDVSNVRTRTALVPSGLIEFYNKKLKEGGVQIIVTGDSFKNVIDWWINKLDPEVRSRIVVLSLSSIECRIFNLSSQEWEIVFEPKDFFNDAQRESWEVFRAAWVRIMLDAADIFLGESISERQGGEQYRYRSGTLNDRGYELTPIILEENRLISDDEVGAINKNLAVYGISVVKGENRRDAMMKYLEIRFNGADFEDFRNMGFNPSMIPVRDVVIDCLAIPWNKGRGLREVMTRRLVEQILGNELDWEIEAEMHADQFSANDGDTAKALPNTPALSVGNEDPALCPPNVIVHKGTTSETIKGPSALLENLQSRSKNTTLEYGMLTNDSALQQTRPLDFS